MYSENHELSLNRHLDQIRGSTIKVCFFDYRSKKKVQRSR